METKYSPESLLALLQAAIREAPSFPYDYSLTDDDQRWLGRVVAILEGSGNKNYAAVFRVERVKIGFLNFSRARLMQPLYDVLCDLELKVPVSQQGAFIPPGDTWLGYAALVRVIQTNCSGFLIVDPYISASIFSELMPHVAASNGTRLLTANQHQILIAQRHTCCSTGNCLTSSTTCSLLKVNFAILHL